MPYSLSFSDSFYFGPEEYPEKSDRPTTVMQAIESLSDELKREIAINVLGCDPDYAHLCSESETFNYDVLAKIRETDTCSDLSSPIDVWIDKDKDYYVTVYEESEDDE